MGAPGSGLWGWLRALPLQSPRPPVLSSPRHLGLASGCILHVESDPHVVCLMRGKSRNPGGPWAFASSLPSASNSGLPCVAEGLVCLQVQRLQLGGTSSWEWQGLAFVVFGDPWTLCRTSALGFWSSQVPGFLAALCLRDPRRERRADPGLAQWETQRCWRAGAGGAL